MKTIPSSILVLALLAISWVRPASAARRRVRGTTASSSIRRLQKEDNNKDKDKNKNKNDDEGNTIMDLLSDAEEYSTLASLLEDANLDAALEGEGPFTVLAPSNEAFAALDNATLEAVQNDPSLLEQVLLESRSPVV